MVIKRRLPSRNHSLAYKINIQNSLFSLRYIYLLNQFEELNTKVDQISCFLYLFLECIPSILQLGNLLLNVRRLSVAFGQQFLTSVQEGLDSLLQHLQEKSKKGTIRPK